MIRSQSASVKDLDEYFNNSNLKILTTTIAPNPTNKDVLKENNDLINVGGEQKNNRKSTLNRHFSIFNQF